MRCLDDAESFKFPKFDMIGRGKKQTKLASDRGSAESRSTKFPDNFIFVHKPSRSIPSPNLNCGQSQGGMPKGRQWSRPSRSMQEFTVSAILRKISRGIYNEVTVHTPSNSKNRFYTCSLRIDDFGKSDLVLCKMRVIRNFKSVINGGPDVRNDARGCEKIEATSAELRIG